MHAKDDVRNAATKILCDLQKHTGCVKEENLLQLPEKMRDTIWEKLQQAQSEAQQLKDADTGEG